MRLHRKRTTCYAYEGTNDCKHSDKKCTFLCNKYHYFIGGITSPNDYMAIINNKFNRRLTIISIIISFFTLFLTIASTTVTIVDAKNNKEIVKVTNGLFDFAKNIVKK